MNIEGKAKMFAIEAHKGQVRKSQKEKPMIIHPINVANILKESGFDENVVAAGFLHDVVEDTKYTEEDILNLFGEDIRSLVMTASEPDKSLSWEERKQHTIDTIKNMDLRHKAVVCADKISNLEDLRIMSEIKGEYDFSSFKRGFDKQKWYYESVYESLIENEDKNNPLFVRLKELIDYIFSNKKDNYIKNTIFNNSEEYDELSKIHYQKQELYKLKSVFDNKPYVIEFTGTPRTGKTTIINNLYDFFRKANFNVVLLEEFTTSKKYKEEVKPLLKDKYKKVVNTEIPKYVLKDLEETIDKNPDIILIDRSLFDRAIWIDRLYLKSGMTKEEYEEYLNHYLPIIKEKINIIIGTYTDSLTSLRRDYKSNLSLEARTFLNEQNVNEYNTSLKNMEEFANKNDVNFKLFDSTNITIRELSINIAKEILKDMREYYIDGVNQEFNKKGENNESVNQKIKK